MLFHFKLAVKPPARTHHLGSPTRDQGISLKKLQQRRAFKDLVSPALWPHPRAKAKVANRGSHCGIGRRVTPHSSDKSKTESEPKI